LFTKYKKICYQIFFDIGDNLSPGTCNHYVLGSVRTGLNFTRSQEGTQLGWLIQTGQTKQGIRYHVPSCWVPCGELAGVGSLVASRECTGHRAVRVALCISTVCFVYSPYQYCCCYSSLHLLFC